jgi:hypothetical protein
MKRILYGTGISGVTVLNAQATAVASVFPPLLGADVAHWNQAEGSIPKFDLEFGSDATTAITGAELHGGIPGANAISSDDFTAATTDICTATTHGLQTGDGPVTVSSDDTLPAGLVAETSYWITRLDANTFKLALSRADALAGVAVDITDTGTGTHSLVGPDAQRFDWHSYGLLGDASDGVINLTATKWKDQGEIRHRPRVEAYAVVHTSDTGNVTVEAYPVLEA